MMDVDIGIVRWLFMVDQDGGTGLDYEDKTVCCGIGIIVMFIFG